MSSSLFPFQKRNIKNYTVWATVHTQADTQSRPIKVSQKLSFEVLYVYQ